MPNRSARAPNLPLTELGRWCERHLGSAPAATLFETGYLSQVIAFALADGREVVVKVREDHKRLVGCHQVHLAMWAAGYPCPRPVSGPSECEGFAASAEEHAPGGEVKKRADADPERFAEALARLVALAPPVSGVASLDPSPPWAAWDHRERGLWPTPDDRYTDLNAVAPSWIDDVARRARTRLAALRAPRVVGHSDWYSANLRWQGETLHTAHDWDSVVAQSEAVIAGLAAAVFPATGAPGEEATVTETEEFLAAYAEARGARWSRDELEAAWAAGLWVRAFDSKKEDTAGKILTLDEAEARERLSRAGAR